MPLTNIHHQLELMPPLPTIYGPADYRELRETLVEMDRLLSRGRLEQEFIVGDLEHRGISSPTGRDFDIRRKMLRCNVLKSIAGLDFRELAVRMADSVLFQWFTGYSCLGPVRTPSKSTLERFSKAFEPDQIQALIDCSLSTVRQPEKAQELLYREAEISVSDLFADSTCLKAAIHFPVDWVLLRDAVRTLVKAMILIRKEGLRHRMPSPEKFLSEMNSLCIAMSQARRRSDSEKRRKKSLRQMKKLAKLVSEHGQRYRDMLDARWEVTSWSRAQAECVLGRIDNVLTKLPRAMRQAHERIIGGRRVASKDKLLSLYEEDVHIIVRGKADAEVEFGNGLYLVEQEDGLIVDWKLFKEYPKSDAHCVEESIERVAARFGDIQSYTADRGFWTKHNNKTLAKMRITNGVCPKEPKILEARLSDPQFVALQKRRAQTEGRIAILKNVYTGNPLTCKGFAHREKAVAWCVLAHNLWTLSTMARKAKAQQDDPPIPIAA